MPWAFCPRIQDYHTRICTERGQFKYIWLLTQAKEFPGLACWLIHGRVVKCFLQWKSKDSSQTGLVLTLTQAVTMVLNCQSWRCLLKEEQLYHKMQGLSHLNNCCWSTSFLVGSTPSSSDVWRWFGFGRPRLCKHWPDLRSSLSSQLLLPGQPSYQPQLQTFAPCNADHEIMQFSCAGITVKNVTEVLDKFRKYHLS